MCASFKKTFILLFTVIDLQKCQFTTLDVFHCISVWRIFTNRAIGVFLYLVTLYSSCSYVDKHLHSFYLAYKEM